MMFINAIGNFFLLDLLSLMGLVTPVKSSIKTNAEDNPVPPEKPRKVTFRENLDVVTPPGTGGASHNQQHHSNNQQTGQSTGGSAGRQLVPGLLLMQDQNTQNFASAQKTGNLRFNIHTKLYLI